jgi:hypothetical protein
MAQELSGAKDHTPASSPRTKRPSGAMFLFHSVAPGIECDRMGMVCDCAGGDLGGQLPHLGEAGTVKLIGAPRANALLRNPFGIESTFVRFR